MNQLLLETARNCWSQFLKCPELNGIQIVNQHDLSNAAHKEYRRFLEISDEALEYEDETYLGETLSNFFKIVLRSLNSESPKPARIFLELFCNGTNNFELLLIIPIMELHV